MRAPFVLAFVLAGSTPAPLPAAGGDLWVVPVAQTCLAQDTRYAATILGRFAAESRLAHPQIMKCLAAGAWASSALCDDVMNLTESQLSQLKPVFERHREAIRRMAPVFEYINAAAAVPSNGLLALECPGSGAK